MYRIRGPKYRCNSPGFMNVIVSIYSGELTRNNNEHTYTVLTNGLTVLTYIYRFNQCVLTVLS